MEQKKLGRPSGSAADTPKDPERVKRVLQLHREDLSFAEIGRRLGISRAGAKHIVGRWKDTFPAD